MVDSKDIKEAVGVAKEVIGVAKYIPGVSQYAVVAEQVINVAESSGVIESSSNSSSASSFLADNGYGGGINKLCSIANEAVTQKANKDIASASGMDSSAMDSLIAATQQLGQGGEQNTLSQMAQISTQVAEDVAPKAQKLRM